MPEAGLIAAGNRPSLFNWPSIADDAALAALTLAATDKGKAAYQVDEETIKVVLSHSPATWLEIASKAYVSAAIAAAVANLLDSAPGTLDTLNELAAALGDDANFATTVTNALALKAPLASPALTGTPTAPTAAADTNSTQLATTAYVDAVKAAKADLASPALTGNPTAPTQTAGNNTTRIATTAFVTTAVAAVGGGASLSADQTWTGVQTYGDAKAVMTTPKIITGIKDTNGNVILAVNPTASATRYVGVKNTNGGNPEVYVTAGGSNSDLVLRPDGAGKVQAIGGVTDNDQWWAKSNSFRPGYMDVVTTANSSTGVRCNKLQFLADIEVGDNAACGTLSFSSNTLTMNISGSGGLKVLNSASQKLGFHGATPVVQQVLATGGGATVDNVISLLQTLGLCKQS